MSGGSAPKKHFGKSTLIVIPNEVRNLSGFECREKRDSSARSVPRNDNVLGFSDPQIELRI
jgi:hypothetical protein